MMCCRTKVYYTDGFLAEGLLIVGQFERRDSGLWARRLRGNQGVQARLDKDGLRFWVEPPVSTWTDHSDKQDAAGVMFEMAARYAQKARCVDVWQEAINVTDCLAYGVERRHRIWNSFTGTVDFDLVCPGFRDVFLNHTLSNSTAQTG
jgi:hypothetical protein